MIIVSPSFAAAEEIRTILPPAPPLDLNIWRAASRVQRYAPRIIDIERPLQTSNVYVYQRHGWPSDAGVHDHSIDPAELTLHSIEHANYILLIFNCSLQKNCTSERSGISSFSILDIIDAYVPTSPACEDSCCTADATRCSRDQNVDSFGHSDSKMSIMYELRWMSRELIAVVQKSGDISGTCFVLSISRDCSSLLSSLLTVTIRPRGIPNHQNINAAVA